MNIKLLYAVTFCVLSCSAYSQNLINTNTWTAGSGSAPGFAQNGTTTENSREYGVGPQGTKVLLWKATPDATRNADGGWNSSFVTINPTKTYRLVIWLKKTHSRNGSSYFGFYSPNNALTLNGAVNHNPYFWYGDLPELNKWYMLVGYVHGSGYTGTVHYGGIYDGTTGKKVRRVTDYKFAKTATVLNHRTYLYYDTNTADRQYFYAPRMELVNGKQPSVQELLLKKSTNLLAPYLRHWTVGCGSVTGFAQNGTTSENCRELGSNHIGENVVLWKAGNDAKSDADGGWNSSWVTVSPHHSYRFSVWIKKTNSHDGYSHFGFYANNSGSLTLNGTYNGNPYFWYGDLPTLNRWYLLVGYVHKNGHKGTTHQGAIYDGTTGEKVQTLTDYTLKNTVTALKHRSYLYYDPNTLDRQYFYHPRMDILTGNAPTITELLHINTQSKITLSYDVAGNQTQRLYCQDPSCSPLDTRKSEEQLVANMAASTTEEQHTGEEESLTTKGPSLATYLHIYPNPTSGQVTLQLNHALLSRIRTIQLYNTNSVLVKQIMPQPNIPLDISDSPSGTYFVHIHIHGGGSITKKIIKN